MREHHPHPPIANTTSVKTALKSVPVNAVDAAHAYSPPAI